jgi:hypothetical protein
MRHDGARGSTMTETKIKMADGRTFTTPITLEDGSVVDITGWKALQRDGKTFWSKKVGESYKFLTSWEAFNCGVEQVNGGDPFKVAKKVIPSATTSFAGGQKAEARPVAHVSRSSGSSKPAAPPKRGSAGVMEKQFKKLTKR